MNQYRIEFDESHTLSNGSTVQPSTLTGCGAELRYHPNYNPKFPKENGSVPYWMCLKCSVGLREIEYCLQCPKCGLIVIKNLWPGWNGPKYPPRNSSYKFELHYQKVMDCILAREEITPALEKVISDVKNEWRRYPMITCIGSVRHVLKKIGHNKHYIHAPLILRRVSGVGPPHIPDSILGQSKFIFSDIVRAYIHCIGSPNSAGYPYIIYKIFDAILPTQPLRDILDFIHLQRAKTITKRDKEWKVICDYIPYL